MATPSLAEILEDSQLLLLFKDYLETISSKDQLSGWVLLQRILQTNGREQRKLFRNFKKLFIKINATRPMNVDQEQSDLVLHMKSIDVDKLEILSRGLGESLTHGWLYFVNSQQYALFNKGKLSSRTELIQGAKKGRYTRDSDEWFSEYLKAKEISAHSS